jgi:predicted nucleic acid-binding protein
MPVASEPIVVNTSPLLALRMCGQIELLRTLHSRVVVPQAVITELERGQAGVDALALDAERPSWLEVVALPSPLSPLLRAYLDEGEASVIALALELGITRVVIDEQRGRAVARTMGLEVTGSVGVLLRAKREGLLAAVKPSLDEMHAHGIWLSERLQTFALREAGEA